MDLNDLSLSVEVNDLTPRSVHCSALGDRCYIALELGPNARIWLMGTREHIDALLDAIRDRMQDA